MTKRQKTWAYWAKEVAKQQRWIQEHGGDLFGYIRRYGSASDPNHYGDGGEAIYAADMAELKNLVEVADHWA